MKWWVDIDDASPTVFTVVSCPEMAIDVVNETLSVSATCVPSDIITVWISVACMNADAKLGHGTSVHPQVSTEKPEGDR